MTPWPACAPAFAGRELSALWPQGAAGHLQERGVFPFTHLFVAGAMRYDAVVIGAGPAGSAAARLLAQAGWQVALVEKAAFPRRKVCGEFISATTMPVLEACGVAGASLPRPGPPVTRRRRLCRRRDAGARRASRHGAGRWGASIST